MYSLYSATDLQRGMRYPSDKSLQSVNSNGCKEFSFYGTFLYSFFSVRVTRTCMFAHTVRTCVEAEFLGKHSVAEPDLAVRVEQPLVVVVGHAAAILDLSDHVANRVPRHALQSINMISKSTFMYLF